MEFELGVDAVCNFIDSYEEIIGSLISNAKAVDNVTKALMDTKWSGAAKEQFEININVWQKQMGKVINDMQFINESFGEILNLRSIELQRKCDSLEEYIKK